MTRLLTTSVLLMTILLHLFVFVHTQETLPLDLLDIPPFSDAEIEPFEDTRKDTSDEEKPSE